MIRILISGILSGYIVAFLTSSVPKYYGLNVIKYYLILSMIGVVINYVRFA